MGTPRSDTIQNMFNFPNDYRSGNISPLELYSRSGYNEKYKMITQEHLLAYLESHPDLVSVWEMYSQDKRTSLTWGFTNQDEGRHAVSYGTNQAEGYQLFFSTAASACAFLVKMEFEELRLSSNNRSERNQR